MSSDAESLRAKVDLLDLVKERVKLTRSGRNWKGNCPFHQDRSPSFFVFEDGRFYCYGCLAHGDIFEWVKRTENVDFPRALEMLAARAGVTLTGKASRSATNSQELREVLETALKFFRARFQESEAAREYASQRGLDRETILSWEIGFAPPGDEELVSYLKRSGLSLKTGGEASVLSGTEAEGYRDFFRGRIIFPIRNERGSLVGFGGRLIASGEPKYLNSRDTEGLFSKSSTLFGLHKAKGTLANGEPAVICEGYLDVIACHRAGIHTALAPLGTSLTETHARMLNKQCASVTLLFDGDTAGQAAARRSIEVLKQTSILPQIAVLRSGDDPDKIFTRDGAEALRQLVKNPISPVRFELDALLSPFSAEPQITDQAFWRSATALLSTADPVEAEALLIELASKHPTASRDRRAAADAIRAQVFSKRPRHGSVKSQSRTTPATERVELPPLAECTILRAALGEEFREDVWSFLSEDGLIVSPNGRALADSILEEFPIPPRGEPRVLTSRLSDEVMHIVRHLDRPADSIYGKPIEPDLRPPDIEDAVEALRRQRERRQILEEYEATADLAQLSRSIRQDSPRREEF